MTKKILILAISLAALALGFATWNVIVPSNRDSLMAMSKSETATGPVSPELQLASTTLQEPRPQKNLSTAHTITTPNVSRTSSDHSADSAPDPTVIAAIPFPENSGPPPLELDLEPGVPLPAAALPSNTPVSSTLAQCTDAIACQFQAEVLKAMANASATDESIAENYDVAKEHADQSYKLLYGDNDCNEQNKRAQMESLSPANP